MRQTFYFFALLSFVSIHTGRAQNVPAKGDPLTFDVATWNIEWFGSASNGPSDDARQFANVKAVIEQADIDLWAVQEIADVNDFDQLLEDLGGAYDGALATLHSGQRVGFIYKTDVVKVRSVGHILESFSSDFASRPPLEMEADVTVGDTTVTLTFITIHMKAFSDVTSYNRRLAASQRLKNHIDFTTLATEPVMVLGDFNDELLDSITPGKASPYDNFVQDTDDYFFPSMALEQAGERSFCSNGSCTSGSNIDQILITDELVPSFVTDSADRYDELISAISSYTSTTSDHLPVLASFSFARPTATASGPELPDAARLAGAYPNPFSSTATVSYELARPGPVRLVVYDALGRAVATLFEGNRPAGSHRAVFDASALPPGLYLLRLRTEHASVAMPLVHTR